MQRVGAVRPGPQPARFTHFLQALEFGTPSLDQFPAGPTAKDTFRPCTRRRAFRLPAVNSRACGVQGAVLCGRRHCGLRERDAGRGALARG